MCLGRSNQENTSYHGSKFRPFLVVEIPETINIATPELQGIFTQSLGRNIVCNKHGFSMPQPKIAQFSI